MTINVNYSVPGMLWAENFVDESREIESEEQLKQIMKKLFSALKKNGGFNNTSFQLCSDSGFYIVVDRYDAESDSFRATFHERFNSCDNPCMKSQKNMVKWALDVFKLDSERATA